ncbi:MAG: hypothetical protein ACT4PT_09850 [Methanobacteriota archaeon]
MEESCPTPSGPRSFAPVLAVLLCVHCTATFLLGAVALFGLASLPLLFGVRADYIALPVLIVGLFGWWIWWGYRRSEAPS